MVHASEVLGARLLVVDDQPSNVLLLERLLGGAGFTSVTSTTDPRQVCELHRKHGYDLILLDLLMPAMYGFQVIEGLKEIETEDNFPVLVISAQPDYRKRAMQAGATEFIAKPIVVVDLLPQVHKMLRARLSYNKKRNDRIALEHAVHERTASLRESEELFRQFAEFSPDAVWIRDIQGELIHYANPSWVKITGRRLAAGDRMDQVFAAIHPSDLPRVTNKAKEFPQGGIDLECRIVRPDDTVRAVHFRTFAIRAAKEKIVRIAGIMEDITERKLAANGIA